MATPVDNKSESGRASAGEFPVNPAKGEDAPAGGSESHDSFSNKSVAAQNAAFETTQLEERTLPGSWMYKPRSEKTEQSGFAATFRRMGGGRSWNKRWVWADDKSIMYGHAEGQAEKTIPHVFVTDVHSGSASEFKKLGCPPDVAMFGFVIDVNEKRIHFAAESYEFKERWLRFLRRVIHEEVQTTVAYHQEAVAERSSVTATVEAEDARVTEEEQHLMDNITFTDEMSGALNGDDVDEADGESTPLLGMNDKPRTTGLFKKGAHAVMAARARPAKEVQPTDTQEVDEALQERADHQVSSKSMFLCLAFASPWNLEEAEIAKGAGAEGAMGKNRAGPRPFLDDGDLLLSSSKAGAPTSHQKVIDIIRRLKLRGLDTHPRCMLKKAAVPKGHPTSLGGLQLNKDAMYFSPDRDQIYIAVHAGSDLLKTFAERQNIVLMTNPYSDLGGVGAPYSIAEEQRLSKTVLEFPGSVPEQYIGKNYTPWGFQFKVPQKQRAMMRLIRTEWKYGGCGIQVLEMKRSGTFLEHIFPMHNPAYLDAYGLRRWGSYKALCSARPLFQPEAGLINYFGEEVTLYFKWIRSYTLFLVPLAFFGAAAELLHYVALVDPPLLAGPFVLICTVWSVVWLAYWQKQEEEFELVNGQGIAAKQEMVRDEYRYAPPPRKLLLQHIYAMDFEYPLTIKYTASGDMVELRYPQWRRTLARFGLTYPVSLLMLAGLFTAMFFLTRWRFDHAKDERVVYGASAITTAMSVVFSIVFEKVLGKLLSVENLRTETEYRNQHTLISFVLYFFNFYSPVAVLAAWPHHSVTAEMRRHQIRAQLLITLGAKPMIQNFQESIIPLFKANLRRYSDQEGSTMKGLLALIKRKQLRVSATGEAERMWREAQLESYEVGADYLEIVVQFGFMLMFASIFPGGVVFCLIYNVIELRVDAWKLINSCQRPLAHPGASIGAWNRICAFIAVAAGISNAYFVVFLMPTLDDLGVESSQQSKTVAFLVLQYVLVVFGIVLAASYGGTPVKVSKMKAKQDLLTFKAERSGSHMQTRALQAPISGEEHAALKLAKEELVRVKEAHRTEVEGLRRRVKELEQRGSS